MTGSIFQHDQKVMSLIEYPSYESLCSIAESLQDLVIILPSGRRITGNRLLMSATSRALRDIINVEMGERCYDVTGRQIISLAVKPEHEDPLVRMLSCLASGQQPSDMLAGELHLYLWLGLRFSPIELVQQTSLTDRNLLDFFSFFSLVEDGDDQLRRKLFSRVASYLADRWDYGNPHLMKISSEDFIGLALTLPPSKHALALIYERSIQHPKEHDLLSIGQSMARGLSPEEHDELDDDLLTMFSTTRVGPSPPIPAVDAGVALRQGKATLVITQIDGKKFGLSGLNHMAGNGRGVYVRLPGDTRSIKEYLLININYSGGEVVSWDLLPYRWDGEKAIPL